MTEDLLLNNLWDSQGCRFTTVDGRRIPSLFTSPEEEYNAGRHAAILLDRSYRAKIKVMGADKVEVLHRLLAGDIKALGRNEGCYTAFLNARGKVIADMFLYLLDDFILLDTEPGVESRLVERLEAFIITEDVTFETVRHDAHLTLAGPLAAKIVSALVDKDISAIKNHAILQGGPDLLICRRDMGELHSFELYLTGRAEEQAENILKVGFAQGLKPAGYEASETLRIAHGIPQYGKDISEEDTLPETGLDRIAASETKGCYPGQEVVARTNTYKGHAKKLVRFICKEGAVPASGDEAMAGDAKAGYLTSAAELPGESGAVALGYLRKGFFETKTGLTILHAGKAIPAASKRISL